MQASCFGLVALSPEPYFPSFDVLLACLLQTWPQYPYSTSLCACPRGSVQSITLARIRPSYERYQLGSVRCTLTWCMDVFQYSHIPPIFSTTPLRKQWTCKIVASSNDSDPIGVPSSSVEVSNAVAWCVHQASSLLHELVIK
jgi:hypothetical protein